MIGSWSCMVIITPKRPLFWICSSSSVTIDPTARVSKKSHSFWGTGFFNALQPCEVRPKSCWTRYYNQREHSFFLDNKHAVPDLIPLEIAKVATWTTGHDNRSWLGHWVLGSIRVWTHSNAKQVLRKGLIHPDGCHYWNKSKHHWYETSRVRFASISVWYWWHSSFTDVRVCIVSIWN